MKRFHATIVIPSILGIMLWSSTAQAQTETQTFDSAASAAAAGWLTNDEGMNPDRGCVDADCATDLGWKDSNLAGGAAAGEGGGLLHRSGDLPIGFYADTTIGELNLDMPFSASGKVALTNINFDGHAHLGFLDTTRLLSDPLDYGAVMGFQIAEPGGDVAPNFRWGYIVVDDAGDILNTNQSFVNGLPDGESLDFVIDYNPEGDGVLTLAIADEDPVELLLTAEQRQTGATFTGFGVFTGPYAGTPRAQSLEILIDDVTYTSLDTVAAAGDYNRDTLLDARDIDLQAAAMNAPNPDLAVFDENGDGLVDLADRTVWVKVHRRTWYGDADLNGEFNSGDLVAALAAGTYEADVAAGWEAGDFDGSGRFNSGDLIQALADGGYEQGPLAAVRAVPEPASVVMLTIGLMVTMMRRLSPY
jgi:hypothetical protein